MLIPQEGMLYKIIWEQVCLSDKLKICDPLCNIKSVDVYQLSNWRQPTVLKSKKNLFSLNISFLPCFLPSFLLCMRTSLQITEVKGNLWAILNCGWGEDHFLILRMRSGNSSPVEHHNCCIFRDQCTKLYNRSSALLAANYIVYTAMFFPAAAYTG